VATLSPVPRRAPTTAALVAACVLAGGLTGCSGGGDDGSAEADTEAQAFAEESAQDILAAAEDATTEVESLRVRGDLTVGEQVVSVDLRVDQAEQCEGTVGRDGVSADVLGVDGAYWIRPDDAYWRGTLGAADAEAVIQAQQGRWVATSGVASLCDPDGLFGSDPTDPDVQLATLGPGEVGGQPVVRVRRTDAEGRSTVSAVSATSPHYLRQVVGEGQARGTRIDVGDFGEALDVEAPASDDQVPLEGLPLPG